MPTLRTVVHGFVCQQGFDNATLRRLQFWVDQLGDSELSAITDDVDAALNRLAERGRLRAGPGLVTVRLGEPLAGSTFNRYVQSIFSPNHIDTRRSRSWRHRGFRVMDGVGLAQPANEETTPAIDTCR